MAARSSRRWQTLHPMFVPRNTPVLSGILHGRRPWMANSYQTGKSAVDVPKPISWSNPDPHRLFSTIRILPATFMIQSVPHELDAHDQQPWQTGGPPIPAAAPPF
ncbi:hypothetical protein ACLOJK_014617 [Asimina triloba]